jgi:hypothetical protein
VIEPKPMTHAELADLLEELAARVRAHDSFEGHIAWELPDMPDPAQSVAETADCLVTGGWRVGNTMGQGGMQFTGPFVQVPHQYRIVMWDWKEQPDPAEIDRAVQHVSRGAAFAAEADTHSDERAIVFSTRPISNADATELFDLWWRNRDDEESA